jgi:tetratricopeptide (TPR) repeat protein
VSLRTFALATGSLGLLSGASQPPVIERELAGSAAGELGYRAEFVGSETCASCHAEQSRSRNDHHMALTGLPVDEATRERFFSAARLEKPIDWAGAAGPPRYIASPGGVFLETTGEGRVPVAAVFGSGARGFTPISAEAGRRIRELRLSFSAKLDAWLLTPGSAEDEDPSGAVKSAEESRDCLDCHASLLVWRDDRLDASSSSLGVQCERCHGPGSAHVEAISSSGGESRIFNPGLLRADGQAVFCGQCHRRPSDIDPLSVMTRAPSMARHAGAGLMLSECFRRSLKEKTITCLDCHDPHENIQASARYRESCLRCHAAPETEHRSQTIGSSSDCVSCHMPVEEKGFQGLRFTDHWIRRPDAPIPLDSFERGEYLEYLEGSYREAALRPGLGDEKMARFRVNLAEVIFAKGDPESAFRTLEEGLSFAPNYSQRLRGASLYRQAGRLDEALATLEGAVRLEPGQAEAYYQQGEILLLQGKADEAVARYRQALERDPASAFTENGLGSALASQGNPEDAGTHFRRALELKPDYAEAHNNLGLALRRTGSFDEALMEFREASRLKPGWPVPLAAQARILATHPDPSRRNPEEAVRLADRACELSGYEHPMILDTLAAAYASASQFEKAVKVAEEALRIASESGARELAGQIEARLSLYRQKQPYVESQRD